jgi:hypothetical protein
VDAVHAGWPGCKTEAARDRETCAGATAVAADVSAFSGEKWYFDYKFVSPIAAIGRADCTDARDDDESDGVEIALRCQACPQ